MDSDGLPLVGPGVDLTKVSICQHVCFKFWSSFQEYWTKLDYNSAKPSEFDSLVDVNLIGFHASGEQGIFLMAAGCPPAYLYQSAPVQT